MRARASSHRPAAMAGNDPSNTAHCRSPRVWRRRASGSSSSTTPVELVDHARVGVGGLQAVETDEQCVVAAGLAGDGDRAPALVEGLAEPQVVRRQHGEAAAEVGLGHAVPERRGPPKAAAEVRDALGGRMPSAIGTSPPSWRSTAISRRRSPASRAACAALRRSVHASS